MWLFVTSPIEFLRSRMLFTDDYELVAKVEAVVITLNLTS